jgi:hypothetical protein
MKKHVGYFILASTLGLVGAAACGSSDSNGSGGPNYQDLCVKVCQKNLDCSGMSGSIDCNQSCTSEVRNCSNQSAAATQANDCLSKTCGADFDACVGQIAVTCGSTSGGSGGQTTASATSTNGGTTGITTGATASTTGATASTTGGITGGTTLGLATTGGLGTTTGSAPSCDTCAMADACCAIATQMAGQSSSTCTFQSSCDSAGTSQSIVAQQCQQTLAALQILYPSCK